MAIATKHDLEELIPQKKLAEMLGVEVKTLCRWAKVGLHGRRLEKVRIGGRVFYEPAAVEAFRTPADSRGATT